MILFFFITGYYSIVYMNHIFIIHLSIEGNLGCLHFLTIVHRAAMKIAEQPLVE